MSNNDKKNVFNQVAWILNYQPRIEHQHFHMGNQTVEDEPMGEAAEGIKESVNEMESTDIDLVEKLKPLFFNNEDDVRLFLKEIKGMQSNDITDLVNRWVQDKRISNYGNSRKGVLWSILNSAGIYTKSRQNWCRRVY